MSQPLSPSGAGTGSWSYAFDAANRLTSTTNPYSETTSLTYDNANRVTQQTAGNGAISVFTYDSANRTTDILHKQAGGTTLAHYQYAYDAASNVTSRTDTDGTVTTFGYDNSDQLTSETRDNSHSTGYSISYTYDHNQNRLTKVLNGTTDAYTYDSHDKLLTAGSKSYTYDSNGNCTKVTVGTSVTTLSYDDSNRVTGITYPSSATNSFVYNGEDLRVSKTDSAGTSAVTTDGATPASPVLKDSRAVYTPGLSEHAGSASKFYHADALGSTRGITDATQATTDAVLYDAFGMTVSRTGSTATPFGFVGAQQYQTDADSGLQLLGHRYYDPSVGRFISADPAKAGTNWYAYSENGPLRATDPTGLDISGHRPGLDEPYAPNTGGVVIVGGSAADRNAVRGAIVVIGTTNTGRRLLSPFGPSGYHIIIRIFPLIDPLGPGSDYPGRSVRPRDDRTGRATVPGDTTITIPPNFIHNPGKVIGPGIPSMDLSTAIVHELGHANGWLDDGPGGMNNVNNNENPYRRERKMMLRTIY